MYSHGLLWGEHMKTLGVAATAAEFRTGFDHLDLCGTTRLLVYQILIFDRVRAEPQCENIYWFGPTVNRNGESYWYRSDVGYQEIYKRHSVGFEIAGWNLQDEANR